MGTLYAFSCGHCGYKASVSGGMDRGIDTVYATVHCLNCHELMDVLAGHISLDPAAPSGIAVAEVRWRCRTGRFHRLMPWEPPGPCPKCGGVIEDGEPCAIWD